MTGAMYSAIAGLRTHMSALNVIGNNISNVNTVGYKATRYTFNEALYTMSRAGSNGTNILGGVNPAQIGYGCNIGTIDLNMSTATYNPTGRALDCMIDGDGFFLVGDKGQAIGDGDGTKEHPFTTASGITTQSQLQGMTLTRVGNFDFKDGFLVDGEGNVVYGFLTVQTAAATEDTPAQTDVSKILTGIRLPMVRQVKVPQLGEDGEELGSVVTYEFFFPTEDQENGLVADQYGTGEGEDAERYERLSPDTVAIDNTGKITAITSDGETIIVGYIAIGKVDSPNGVTHTNGRFYQALDGAGYLRLTTIGGSVVHVPGEGEEGDGENALYDSDLPIEDAGGTTMWTSGLESSNTDLATEISNMIVIQRGYQANTRIVTVTDSMLEELVNLKR